MADILANGNHTYPHLSSHEVLRCHHKVNGANDGLPIRVLVFLDLIHFDVMGWYLKCEVGDNEKRTTYN